MKLSKRDEQSVAARVVKIDVSIGYEGRYYVYEQNIIGDVFIITNLVLEHLTYMPREIIVNCNL